MFKIKFFNHILIERLALGSALGSKAINKMAKKYKFNPDTVIISDSEKYLYDIELSASDAKGLKCFDGTNVVQIHEELEQGSFNHCIDYTLYIDYNVSKKTIRTARIGYCMNKKKVLKELIKLGLVE